MLVVPQLLHLIIRLGLQLPSLPNRAESRGNGIILYSLSSGNKAIGGSGFHLSLPAARKNAVRSPIAKRARRNNPSRMSREACDGSRRDNDGLGHERFYVFHSI